MLRLLHMSSQSAQMSMATPTGDTRLMLRAAQLYYHGDLTQDAVGKRLGVSRFKVGRLLDRALKERAVRIEIVHPAARLVALEDALVERFGLAGAVVVDVPDAEDEQLARERVASAAADQLAAIAPSGVIGVSWGRTMIELAARLQPGWTSADQIVQLNGAISRSAQPTRYQEVVERFGSTTGAAIQLMPAPAIVGTPELREALEADPCGGGAAQGCAPGRQRRLRHGRHGRRLGPRGLGLPGQARPAPLAEGRRRGRRARPLHHHRRPHRPALARRAHGGPAPVPTLRQADGRPRGRTRPRPVALGALRAGCMKTLVTDETTAAWVLAHD